MNITDIMNTIDAIKALPVSEINKRQPMLIDLLVEMVNSETSDGEGTELNSALESQDWWSTLKELTHDAGFKLLGNGHFSAAYSHPLLPNRVIKVGFKKEDSGAAYTAFCRMHQGRPGIPNIYDVQRHAGCYTVVLDALIEADTWSNDTHEHYAEIARDVIEYNSKEHNELTGWDGEFVETCKMIRKFFDGIASFDMHSGNIMFTHGDVPYITDPVSFTMKASDKPVSIDPDELIEEIKQVRFERWVERCKLRKERHVNRLELRKAKRQRRKARKAHHKNVRKMQLEWRQAARMEVRNEQRAKDLLGIWNWQNQWCRHKAEDFKKLEERAAAAHLAHDMLAIMAGNDLMVDKMFDKMFQG